MFTEVGVKVFGRKIYKNWIYTSEEDETLESFLGEIAHNYFGYQSEKMQPRVFAYLRVKSNRRKGIRNCIAGITKKEFENFEIDPKDIISKEGELRFTQACRMAEYNNRDDIFKRYSDLMIYSVDESGYELIARFEGRDMKWAKIDSFTCPRFRKLVCSLKLI